MLFEVYLIHEVGDGLYHAAVFLRQEAVSPLLLLQSLAVALPEELQILTAILRTHIIDGTYIYSTGTRSYSAECCSRVQK